MTKLFKNCAVCDTVFYKKSSDSKKYWNKRKCCSKECSLEISGFKKGEKSWNSGLVGVMPTPWNKGTKGIMKSNSGSFKKGDSLNEKHPNWKGDEAHIKSKHSWVRRHKGKAKECSKCDKTSDKFQIDWANIDHKYKRNLDDYIELCRSCHRLHDIENNAYLTKRKFYGKKS